LLDEALRGLAPHAGTDEGGEEHRDERRGGLDDELAVLRRGHPIDEIVPPGHGGTVSRGTAGAGDILRVSISRSISVSWGSRERDAASGTGARMPWLTPVSVFAPSKESLCAPSI